MKTMLLLLGCLSLLFVANGQTIQYMSDAQAAAKQIDSLKTIRIYERSHPIKNSLGREKKFARTYFVDSVTGKLIKAIIQDERYSIARTYYFLDDRLVKFYEKCAPPAGKGWSRISFFRDDKYSVFNTGMEYVSDETGKRYHHSRGELPHDNAYFKSSYIKREPELQSPLEEAYILLIDFRKVSRQKD
jgi:hypothetical protein